jgi:hypothetical protein
MIDRNRSNCKCVDVITHYVGSAGAQRRGRVFSEGKNTKRWESPKVAGLLTTLGLEKWQKVISPCT